jgi:hypothetical protein
MHEACLMQVGSALKAIKKRGCVKAHKDANLAYVAQHDLVKQTKATLAKLDGAISNGTGSSRKSSKKLKKNAATGSQSDQELQAEYLSEIKQAQDTTEIANANAEQDTLDIIQLYVNLLSVNAKYTWD